MRASIKKRLKVLGAFVLIVTIIPPVLIGAPREIEGQKGGDPWRNIIFDFQTLITGLLAVGAATWTVATMEKTDRRAEERHRQLVNLSVRADRLRVERLMVPALSQLEFHYEVYSAVAVKKLKEMLPEAPLLVAEVASQALGSSHHVTHVISTKPFAEALDLFSGDLAYRYGLMEAGALGFEANVSNLISFCRDLEGAKVANQPSLVTLYSQDALRALDRFERGVAAHKQSLGELIFYLRLMKSEYRFH
ncbi:hypothetical protein [Agrobacterium sp. SORGH_AS 787]|uniref:hypothetical protein n=1 Tax=Agrobacterium sp. SORGH_AS 787 TaxID=3041775 RepID=UPI0032B78096